MSNKFIVTLAIIFSGHIIVAQENSKNFITEAGLTLSYQQFDSVKNSGLPVALIGDTLIHGQKYSKIKIYKDLIALNTFTTKHEGKRLPDIDLKLINGEQVNSRDLEGKIVMINLWSTSCKPCIAEIPELNKLQKKYEGKVVFLAPLAENTEKTKKLLNKHNFQFQIAPNSTNLFKKLEVDGYPKNLFIDKNGIIRKVTEGTPKRRDSLFSDWYISVLDDYSAILDQLLAETESNN